MRRNEWGACTCGCGGLAFPRGEGPEDLSSPLCIVWGPGVEVSGSITSFGDVSKARVDVFLGGVPSIKAEFDTLEEAKAWGLATLRLEGGAT